MDKTTHQLRGTGFLMNRSVRLASSKVVRTLVCTSSEIRNGELVGVLGSHVGNTVTRGIGPEYEQALKLLRARFSLQKMAPARRTVLRRPLQTRQWHVNHHDPTKLRPAHLPTFRRANRASLLDKKEVSVLRGINGSLNWLSSPESPRFVSTDKPEPSIVSWSNSSSHLRSK